MALGNEPERRTSVLAIRSNGASGCVLDLLAFWTAWRLKALDCIAATCGPIQLTQSVVDRLRHRRERLHHSSQDGGRSARYQDGKIAVTEIAAEVINEWVEDVDAAITWVEENAIVMPLVIGDSLPEAIREQLRSGQSDVFDSLALAMQTGRLLISDDLPTREIGRLLSFEKSAWLHQVFGCALERKRIDFDTFIRWTASLVEACHGYIGVSAYALARSLAMDAEEGTAPGYLFSTLSKVLGGCAAEPRSHLMAVVGCLREIWTGHPRKKYREAATGVMLRQLIRERNADYSALLSAVNDYVSDIPPLVDYLELLEKMGAGMAKGSRFLIPIQSRSETNCTKYPFGAPGTTLMQGDDSQIGLAIGDY